MENWGIRNLAAVRKLKTITLYQGDKEPFATILPGRHSLEQFNRAFDAEGRCSGDSWTQIVYEPWTPEENNIWRQIDGPKAMLCTVGYW